MIIIIIIIIIMIIIKIKIAMIFWTLYLQAQEPTPSPDNDLYSYRRGDIPIFNDEGDRLLVATLQELIEVTWGGGRGS